MQEIKRKNLPNVVTLGNGWARQVGLHHSDIGYISCMTTSDQKGYRASDRNKIRVNL